MRSLFIIPDSIGVEDLDCLRVRFFTEPPESLLRRYVNIARSCMFGDNIMVIVGENIPKDIFSFAISALSESYPTEYSSIDLKKRIICKSYSNPTQLENIKIDIENQYPDAEFIELTNDEMDRRTDVAKAAGLKVRGFKDEDIEQFLKADKDHQADMVNKIKGAFKAAPPGDSDDNESTGHLH